MTNKCLLLLTLALAFLPTGRAEGQISGGPDTVVVRSGTLKLRALLWRPRGSGPFPAVLFSHGSGNTLDQQSAQSETLGPVFAGHGYIFLFVFRRGSGLSADQGTSAAELMNREFTAHGQEARNKLQLRLLETDHLKDALAGLALLRTLPDVDKRRIAASGHSFGASLTLLLAEHDTSLRAAVVFSGSAASWEHSPQLRKRLLAAVGSTTVPVFFIQAANDYSISPARVLSAEMARLGKTHRVMIYPPVGQTSDEGHAFVYLKVGTWEPDVFAFLNEHMQR